MSQCVPQAIPCRLSLRHEHDLLSLFRWSSLLWNTCSCETSTSLEEHGEGVRCDSPRPLFLVGNHSQQRGRSCKLRCPAVLPGKSIVSNRIQRTCARHLAHTCLVGERGGETSSLGTSHLSFLRGSWFCRRCSRAV